jgi:hypothetical protein
MRLTPYNPVASHISAESAEGVLQEKTPLPDPRKMPSFVHLDCCGLRLANFVARLHRRDLILHADDEKGQRRSYFYTVPSPIHPVWRGYGLCGDAQSPVLHPGD